MGTFADTAIFDYLLSFADQGKQTSAFRFRLQHTDGSLPFMFSVCKNKRKSPFSVSSVLRLRKQKTWTWRHEIETQKHEDTDMDMETWTNGDMETPNENGSPGYFPLSGYRLLILQKEVCRLSVC
jgi:hypothetical protein